MSESSVEQVKREAAEAIANKIVAARGLDLSSGMWGLSLMMEFHDRYAAAHPCTAQPVASEAEIIRKRDLEWKEAIGRARKHVSGTHVGHDYVAVHNYVLDIYAYLPHQSSSAAPAAEQAEPTGEIKRLQMIIERDRTAFTRAINAIEAEIASRRGTSESRGSYEWDDDNYRREFGWALDGIEKITVQVRKDAHAADWTDCPQDSATIAAAKRGEIPPPAAEQAEPPAAPPLPSSGWIASGDRLPTHNYSVLGYVVKGGLAGEHGSHPFIDIVCLIPGKGWKEFVRGEEEDAPVMVSHWMDLPAPPSQPAETAEQAEPSDYVSPKPKTIGHVVGKFVPAEQANGLIESARSVVMTDAEKEAQRRSFVYGNVSMSNPSITREDIDKTADEVTAASPPAFVLTDRDVAILHGVDPSDAVFPPASVPGDGEAEVVEGVKYKRRPPNESLIRWTFESGRVRCWNGPYEMPIEMTADQFIEHVKSGEFLKDGPRLTERYEI